MDPMTVLFGALLLSRARSGGAAPHPGPAPAPNPIKPPPFPNGIPDQPDHPSAGMLKAVEIWRMQGAVTPSADTTPAELVSQAQLQFPHGWGPLRQSDVTAIDVQKAVSLLGVWQKGRILFDGPMSPNDRRAYVMTEHPRHTTRPVGPAPAPGPGPAPTPPAPVPPAPGPAPGPAPAPEPLPPAPDPGDHPGPTPTPATHKITTVRPREGLANIAIRLLGHEGNTAWPELRAVNIPHDADGRARSKIATEQGGIHPILQPGQHLWVPDNWDVDPGLL